MKKLVSVIIPVYNGKDFIERCVNSVLNQIGIDINSLDILLINDGSTDNSKSIIDSIERRNPSTVRVIHQENIGVAETRNKGILLSRGEFVVFIDQDDYIDDNYMATYLKEMINHDYDVITGGYRRPDATGKIIKQVRQSDTEYGSRYKISAAWSKMHRTDFLRDNNIKFFSNPVGEDVVFCLNEAVSTDKIKVINYIGYNWFWNEQSVSNTSQKKIEKHSILKLIDRMTDLTSDNLSSYYLLQTGVYYLLYSGRLSPSGDFIELYDSIFKIINNSQINCTWTGMRMFGPTGASPLARLTISSFILLHNMRLVSLFAKLYCRG